MNCLCCGKQLKKDDSIMWHKTCIKRFFGTERIPDIEIDDETLEALAIEETRNGFTVPGVQKKLSLHLHSEKNDVRLTLVNYPTGYILKPQIERFEAMPEAEQLVMNMAEVSGIKTVPHALVKSGDDYAYITKRIDRTIDKNGVTFFAMEDFCQLDLRLTEDKYKGSYERCAKIIEKYSSMKNLDMTELFIRLVFCFVTGNSDMHLKNFSLIETEEKSGEYVLSPAYDLLPVNVIMPEDAEQFALTMNGKKRNIHKKDFIVFAETCGISKHSAEKMISSIVSLEENYIAMCKESYLPSDMKESFVSLIIDRCKILK